jgi:hypothetical protein
MALRDWHVSIVQKGDRQMFTYPQVHVRMETIGLPYTTMTVLIHEDSLTAVTHQPDTLERLIGWYGTQASWGEPQTEPPRQTASSAVTRSAVRPRL